VNEAISDNPNEYFRNSVWYRICGEDFMAKAFEYAHEADPNALLFYNDYNETNPVKREKIIRMVKGLQAKGIPINGVGLQAHWSMQDITSGKVDSTLSDFASWA
jgi:endo-1,4-beta-xylanase